MSSKRRIRRKACKGKQRFTSLGDAWTALRSLIRRQGRPGGHERLPVQVLRRVSLRPHAGGAAAREGWPLMETMDVKYTGQTANLQLGNEIAQRSVDFIRSRYPRDRHARLFLIEARRLSATHWKTAVTPRRDLLGTWYVDRDYAESLKQAAANMIWMALRERGAAPAMTGVTRS